MNQIPVKPIDSGGKKMRYRDRNTEAYEVIKKQLRNELIDSRGDHTTDWRALSQSHERDAGKNIEYEDKIHVQCPIPMMCCDQRDRESKYGCRQEDRDCALNMMLKTDFDNEDDDDEENTDTDDDLFNEDDDPIEFD